MCEAKSELLSVTEPNQIQWKDTEIGLNTHLLKGMSSGSRACYLHGSELWIGGRGWHIHPRRLLCGCDLTKWRQAFGRCGWSKRPSSGIPLGTVVPLPPAGCPETWTGSAIWIGYWPWRRLCVVKATEDGRKQCKKSRWSGATLPSVRKAETKSSKVMIVNCDCDGGWCCCCQVPSTKINILCAFSKGRVTGNVYMQ